MNILLYDDPRDIPNFHPFTQSRPIGELRYGAWLIRERISHALGEVVALASSSNLREFRESGAPPVVTTAKGPIVALRSTFIPASLPAAKSGSRLVDAAGETVGAVLVTWSDQERIKAEWPAVRVEGYRLTGIWQIIGDLVPTLRADLAAVLTKRGTAKIPSGITVIGDPSAVLIDETAQIEPHVVLDTRGGPVWIRAGAEIRSFARLAGPIVVGEQSRIVGGQLRESSIGPRCTVHGEVSNSVFLGYANKSHDGFLGHSIVGRWANLGAGTITSNLKNTYGTIRLNLGSERVETGMQFLGSLVGDHVKTAIGTMLPTGCVIGTGANLFGTKRPESYVPAFAWGTDEPTRRVACRMFLQTASKVLPRRDVAFDDATRAYLEAVWKHCTGQPCD